ncbi:monooxygenase [Daedalea quercina L-15889]|uniref:Monooxygenase n=1 Tax=Daedalea quercina L-15889 TaxID=1314783 RepID=A0A165QL95_9APHY|nr:monooxygenase [Daedalea quercina L-15889]
MSEDKVPVLIVGAGPAGLAAALTLRKNGIPVRIIEKEDNVRVVGQRGAGIMPRTQELFQALSVLDDMRAKSILLPPMQIYRLPEGVEPINTFLMEPLVAPAPSRPYTKMILLGQYQTEEILRTNLDCKVDLGATLYSIQPEDDHVEAHILRKEGDQELVETIKCRWLIGTDGARGVVRKQLGLAFDGEAFGPSLHLVIADVEVQGLDAEHWHHWGDMRTIVVAMRPTEQEGIYAIALGGQIDHAKIVLEREELERVVEVGTGRKDIKLGRVCSIAEWKPQVRMTETFRKGHVFVAGDAAHIHTPFGGQGLNSSVQDVVNLGWKLSLVEKGIAAPSLLDSYTEERLPVIAQMLRMSTKLFNNFQHLKADGTKAEGAWARGGDLDMFGVNYRWSSIVVDERTPKEATPVDPYEATPVDPYGATHSSSDVVRAGERAPDAPGLIVLSPTGGTMGGSQETTSLYNLLGPTYHTALIFGERPDDVAQFVSALGHYPSELLRKVLIRKESAPSSIPDGVDLSVIDRDGHAYGGYQIKDDEGIIIIVRPDSVIGGIVRSPDGARRYFSSVFSAN